MMSQRVIILISVFLTILVSACHCSFSRGFQEIFSTRSDSQQRSMSDAIIRFLDYLFPKDDKETRMLKELFGYFADDELPGLEGSLDALDVLLHDK